MVSGVEGVYRQARAFTQHNKHISNVVMSSTRLQASDAEYIIVIFVCIELFLLGRTSAVNYNLFDKVFQLYLSCRRWRNSNNMIVKISSFSE